MLMVKTLSGLKNMPCLKEREENTLVNWCQISMMTEEVEKIQQLVLNQCFLQDCLQLNSVFGILNS
jgi:hypothetical protein